MDKCDGIEVSIICNTYNHVDYIRKTLDSFLMQKTTFKFEILIHDDASTDGTCEIIKEYEEMYPNIVKPIYQKENQFSKGSHITTTYQIPRAQGKYLAFCEGDDYWTDNNKLQVQYDFLEKNSLYVGCVHKYKVVDQYGKSIHIKTFAEYEKAGVYDLKMFQNQELPSQLATYFVRNIFDQNDLYHIDILLDIGIQGDVILNIFWLSKGPFYRLDTIMSAYRFVMDINGKSWSSRYLLHPHGYSNFFKYRELERMLKTININVSLKKRINDAAWESIRDIKNHFCLKTISHAIIIVVLYPQVLLNLFLLIKEK